MPKTSPEMGKVKLPRAVSSKAITSPAPRDAPLETPKVKGEARGFLSTDCTVTPHTERDAPVIKLSSTRGKRISRIMLINLLSTPSRDVPKRIFPKMRNT